MMYRSQIATDVEKISMVQNARTFVNDMIQIALERVYQYYDWPYYLDYKHGVLTTVETYDTGTIEVTNGSATVTGTTTVWTSAMVGRKIRVSNDKPYYRIKSINTVAQTLVLDNVYQGTDDSSASYEIFKDEYLLKPDVDKHKTFVQIQNSIPVLDLYPQNFDNLISVPTAYSDPNYAFVVGSGQDNYTTGTISGTGTTITGVGTGWSPIEGLDNMSKIRVGNYWYTIKSVDSDTQITTYETLPTITAGTSYVIPLNNIVVQLYPVPDSARHLYYRYYRFPMPLANDYDLPDMPYDYHYLLMFGALSEVMSQKGDINKSENLYETRFITGLERMKLKIGNYAPELIRKRMSADSLRRSVTRALESPNFDKRYSW